MFRALFFKYHTKNTFNILHVMSTRLPQSIIITTYKKLLIFFLIFLVNFIHENDTKTLFFRILSALKNYVNGTGVLIFPVGRYSCSRFYVTDRHINTNSVILVCFHCYIMFIINALICIGYFLENKILMKKH